MVAHSAAPAAKRARVEASVAEAAARGSDSEDGVVVVVPQENVVVGSAAGNFVPLCKELEKSIDQWQAAEDEQRAAERAALKEAQAKAKEVEAAQSRIVEAGKQAAQALEALRGAAGEAAAAWQASCKALQGPAVPGTTPAHRDVHKASLAALREKLASESDATIHRLKAAEASRAEAEARAAALEKRCVEEKRVQAEVAAKLEEAQTAVTKHKEDLDRVTEEARGAALERQAELERLAKEAKAAAQLQLRELQQRVEQAEAAAKLEGAQVRKLEDEKMALEKQLASLQATAASRAEGGTPATAPDTEEAPAETSRETVAAAGDAERASERQTTAGQHMEVDPKDPSPALMKRAARRLLVSTKLSPDLCGEYRLVEGVATNGRPIYRAAASKVPFLVWSPLEGGSWVFTAETPTPEGLLMGQQPPLARCLQGSWTSLPEELLPGGWTQAGFGCKGSLARVAVIRA